MHEFFTFLSGYLLKVEFWIILAILIPTKRSLFGLFGFSLNWRRLGLLSLIALAVFPIGSWLLYPLETRYGRPADLSDAQGIIILGGAEDFYTSNLWGRAEFGPSSERVTAAIELAHQYPHLQIMIAGGGAKGARNTKYASEAHISASLLEAAALHPDRIRIESSSANTMQNAVNALSIVMPEEGEKWVLITSAFHMPRAIWSFERAGWRDVIPYPVDYQSRPFASGIGLDLGNHLHVLNIWIKEIVGTLMYKVLY